MIDPVFASISISSVALLFATAALHKWRDYASFREILARYEILPDRLARAVAWCVPALETAIAIGLLAPRTRLAAQAAAVTMLLAYAAAIGINVRRGRRTLECGCGGAMRQPIGPWMAWRNLAIAAALLPTLLPSSPRELGALDAATVALAVAVLALLYLSTERLMALATHTRLQNRAAR